MCRNKVPIDTATPEESNRTSCLPGGPADSQTAGEASVRLQTIPKSHDAMLPVRMMIFPEYLKNRSHPVVVKIL